MHKLPPALIGWLHPPPHVTRSQSEPQGPASSPTGQPVVEGARGKEENVSMNGNTEERARTWKVSSQFYLNK